MIKFYCYNINLHFHFKIQDSFSLSPKGLNECLKDQGLWLLWDAGNPLTVNTNQIEINLYTSNMQWKKHFRSKREESGIARKDQAIARLKATSTNHGCVSPVLTSRMYGRLFWAPKALDNHATTRGLWLTLALFWTDCILQLPGISQL